MLAFVPVLILGLGAMGLTRVQEQRMMPLAAPLELVPDTLLGFRGSDVVISPAEQRAAGMDQYLMRVYTAPDSAIAFSIYVGYYEAQRQGRTIHSPKNCLPGAGWEPLSARAVPVWDAAQSDSVLVNRYELANGPRRAIVYYWYQGRGRVAWNEYAVKWDLLRDKARWGRSEEALVRVVVPVSGTGVDPDEVAGGVAAALLPAVARALPTVP